jgi:7-carboxy-7-deazaguanine synthase
MINIQPIEKLKVGDGLQLDVHSVFYTIQGEGPLSGQSAVFVRLAGCNLQCPGCDTEYTQGRRTVPIDNIVEEIEQCLDGEISYPLQNTLVVITGGEPFRQNLGPLLEELVAIGLQVQIETNGTLPMPKMDAETMQAIIIVCSPKTGKIHPTIYKHAECFKYVLDCGSVNPFDGLPIQALNHSASPCVARPRPGAKVYLQPMDRQDTAKNLRNVEAVRKSCMQYNYTMQLQIHKIIGVA